MFDGHGGLDAAIYAANHLHVNLVRQEMFNQDPIEALCHAFKVTDERFVQKASREVSYYPINRGKELTQAIFILVACLLVLHLINAQYKLFSFTQFFLNVKQKLRCGTTGVVTFLRGHTLYVAWLGDSQVMMVRRGQPVELMKPHKPDREVRKTTCKANEVQNVFCVMCTV